MTYSDFAQLMSYLLAALVLVILYFTVRASIREARYHRRLRELEAGGAFLESLEVMGLEEGKGAQGERLSWRGWTGTRFELFDENLLGRGPDCDIRLIHDTVSVHHARIFRQGTHLFIEDMDSKNGVLVNGGRMAKEARWKLEDGDEIRLGRVLLKVLLMEKA